MKRKKTMTRMAMKRRRRRRRKITLKAMQATEKETIITILL